EPDAAAVGPPEERRRVSGEGRELQRRVGIQRTYEDLRCSRDRPGVRDAVAVERPDRAVLRLRLRRERREAIRAKTEASRRQPCDSRDSRERENDERRRENERRRRCT